MVSFRTIFPLALFAALGFAAFQFHSITSAPSGPRDWVGVMKAAGIGQENPQARHRWELMRLRDPATGTLPPNIIEREHRFARTLPTREGAVAAGLSRVQGNFDWVQRGPYNVGGRTRAFAIDRTNENHLLAGGVSGGMWSSSNGGASWIPRTGSTQHPSVSCIAQSRIVGKESVWYYGTGEFTGNSAANDGDYIYKGTGIYRSTNGGITWEQLPSTATTRPNQLGEVFETVLNIATDPTAQGEDVIYAAVRGGILRSSDGGGSWKRVLGVANGSHITDVAVTSAGVCYATMSGAGASTRGIWRSANGEDWKQISPADWPTLSFRIVIAVAPSNENILYVLAETPGKGFATTNSDGETEHHSFYKYTYVSGDGSGSGGTWENRSTSLPAFGGDFGEYTSQNSYDMLVKVKPDNPDVVLIGGTNLYLSTNGFANSQQTKWIGGYRSGDVSQFELSTEYPNHHPDQHAAEFLPSNPSVLLSANDGGVFRTNNCLAPTVAWTPLNNGYTTSQFYTAAVDMAANRDEMVMGGLQDNGTWLGLNADPNSPWKLLGGGDGSFCAIASGKSQFYGSAQEGFILGGTVNSTGSVTSFKRVDPDGGGPYLFINPFMLDPDDNKVMYLAGGEQLWVNTDLTAIPNFSTEPATINWHQVPNVTLSNDVISAVASNTLQYATVKQVWFGTERGKLYRVDNPASASPNVFNATGTNFPEDAYINCVSVNPKDPNNVMVVFCNYNVLSLFATTDGGISWVPVAGNLEENPDGTGAGPSLRWAAISDGAFGPYWLIGTSTGLYSTRQLAGMNTVWEQEEAIGNTVVNMVVARPKDRWVVVVTHGKGVFSAYAPSLDVPKESSAASFAINAISPNPVRRAATVSLTVPDRLVGKEMSGKIYNSLGQEVGELPPAIAVAGENRVALEEGVIAQLSAGRYFVGIRIGGVMESREFVVAR
ncbi:MAG: flagellar basal body rod modification protein [Chlorobi bacterium CHB2]|nr:flagellar basal body rod modification protein [Chlorobi bacterium CHB2]